MLASRHLPKLSAPSYRETKSAQTFTQMYLGDLREVQKQAALWVRSKTKEELKKQWDLGNSRQVTVVVDGSKTKEIDQAERRTVVYFITAVLTRALLGAKSILVAAIARGTHRRTGLLQRWHWYFQPNGMRGRVRPLGENLPSSFTMTPGDSLLLVPLAPYALFANSYVVDNQRLMPKIRKSKKGGRGPGKLRHSTTKGPGFIAYTTKKVRSDLKHVGFYVYGANAIAQPPAPQGTKHKYGVPIIVFTFRQGVRERRGVFNG